MNICCLITPAETVMILKMLQKPAECYLKCFQGRALLEDWLQSLHVAFFMSSLQSQKALRLLISPLVINLYRYYASGGVSV